MLQYFYSVLQNIVTVPKEKVLTLVEHIKYLYIHL